MFVFNPRLLLEKRPQGILKGHGEAEKGHTDHGASICFDFLRERLGSIAPSPQGFSEKATKDALKRKRARYMAKLKDKNGWPSQFGQPILF